MASDWLLDELGIDIVNDKRWLYALAHVCEFGVPGPLAQRFAKLLTPNLYEWLKEQDLGEGISPPKSGD